MLFLNMMEIVFCDNDMDKLEVDADYGVNYPDSAIAAYRKALQIVRAAPNENTLFNLRSLRFQEYEDEEVKAFSIPLSNQLCLVGQLQGGKPRKRFDVLGIKKYKQKEGWLPKNETNRRSNSPRGSYQ